MKVLVFENGNMAGIDGDRQVPELTVGWPELYARWAEGKGYDPEGWVIQAPEARFELFRTSEGGWNWRVL